MLCAACNQPLTCSCRDLNAAGIVPVTAPGSFETAPDWQHGARRAGAATVRHRKDQAPSGGGVHRTGANGEQASQPNHEARRTTRAFPRSNGLTSINPTLKQEVSA